MGNLKNKTKKQRKNRDKHKNRLLTAENKLIVATVIVNEILYVVFAKSDVCFILRAHLSLDQVHFQCSAATCGQWPVLS